MTKKINHLIGNATASLPPVDAMPLCRVYLMAAFPLADGGLVPLPPLAAPLTYRKAGI